MLTKNLFIYLIGVLHQTQEYFPYTTQTSIKMGINQEYPVWKRMTGFWKTFPYSGREEANMSWP